MKGTFHPKIQFYAGRESVLVLVGSGNLTVMGHGRNLEVWSPVMVESAENPAYPFIRNVWSYLKSLYQGLGEEAENIIYSIEENCDLLRNDDDEPAAEHFIGEDSIRFFTNQSISLYEQCREWIGNDTIKTITVMSPFYDSKAELIKALYKQYKPQEIRLIIEEGFGSLPKPGNIPDYVKLYKWDKIAKASERRYQDYFHSKCFFFEGESNHYMLCGSANASVAAFRTYRKRVADKYGEDAERDIYLGRSTEVVENVDENGNITVEEHETLNPIQEEIVLVFDSTCREWRNDPSYIKQYLDIVQRNCDIIYQTRSTKHLYLMELIDAMGMPREQRYSGKGFSEIQNPERTGIDITSETRIVKENGEYVAYIPVNIDGSITI
jgi:hypothetical protein